jgi:oligopeptide/dipeptide ABC transporter ATP-binding protein
MSSTLLSVQNLTKTFSRKATPFSAAQVVRAVDDVSLSIQSGETLGLVGESGSGKSTVGQMIARLISPTSGSIEFEGREISRLGRADAFDYARSVQVIFQDPYSSLNPQRTVEQTLSRPLIIHAMAKGRSQVRRAVVQILEEAGLLPGEKYLARYPHEMSGGERQRVAIARALSTKPKLIVADEAVSSLDVSIRSQLLNLLKDLQNSRRLSYLFITHDLATLGYVSQRVAVMYLGNIMEIGPTKEVLERPMHPYTRELLAAIPVADPSRARKNLDPEPTANTLLPIDHQSGCKFQARCKFANSTCSVRVPVVRLQERLVYCHPNVAGL